jgi:uncharacterized membrane protein YfcA
MPELPPLAIAGVAFAMALGGFAKGVSGISLGLIAVSMATVFVDIRLAVALMTVSLVVANLWQVGANKLSGSVIREFWPVYVSIPPGVAIGAKVLTSVDPGLVSGIAGVIVVGFGLLLHLQPDWEVPQTAKAKLNVPVGLFGGIIAGLAGMVPSVLIYMVALKMPRERFVAAIGVGYLTAIASLMAFLAGYDYLTTEMVLWSSLAAVPMFAGQLLGHRCRQYISEKPFRLIVLLLMLAGGANLIRKAVF